MLPALERIRREGCFLRCDDRAANDSFLENGSAGALDLNLQLDLEGGSDTVINRELPLHRVN
jgi:hypothetical protein